MIDRMNFSRRVIADETTNPGTMTQSFEKSNSLMYDSTFIYILKSDALNYIFLRAK